MSMWLYIVTQPVYLLACVLVGVAGRKRRTGMFGYFFLSFVLTPLVMLFVLFVGGEKPPPPERDELDEPSRSGEPTGRRKR